MNKIFKQIRFLKVKYIVIALLAVIIALSFYIYNINKKNEIQNLSKSVLMLNIYNTKNEKTAIGSGFVAFQDNILVTNYHVIENAFKVEAVSEDDDIYSLEKVIAFDKEKDLALLKFSDSTHLNVLELLDSSKILKGTEVIAIGSPLGLKNTVSTGVVSSIRDDNGREVIQITAPISSGSSGGALINKKGKIIGVTYAGIEEGQNINLAIPANDILNLYYSKSNEIDIQEFFYAQNPVEKYKLECEIVELTEIFNHPGQYHDRDVCVKGWVSSSMNHGGAVYIVENINAISGDANYDNGLSSNETGRVIYCPLYGLTVKTELREGDYITVYGKLTDRELITKYFGSLYNKSIKEPVAIEIN